MPGKEEFPRSSPSERRWDGSPVGADTLEALETLLEDALVLRDRAMLLELFEESALLSGGDGWSIHGADKIAHAALTLWHGTHNYVADPQRVMQVRDISLIISKQALAVTRRGSDGAWRYVIVRLTT